MMNTAVFVGIESSNDILINDTMSDDEEVKPDVPPRYLCFKTKTKTPRLLTLCFFPRPIFLANANANDFYPNILYKSRLITLSVQYFSFKSAQTTRPPMQPIKRGKFVEYKASASDSHVGPIKLKLLPAILQGMGILKSIWSW